MVNFIETLRMLALKMALQISSDSVYEDSFALLTGWSINYLLGFWMRDLDCYVTTRIHLQKKIWLTATAETKKSNISSEPHLLFLSSKSINWSQYLMSWGNLILIVHHHSIKILVKGKYCIDLATTSHLCKLCIEWILKCHWQKWPQWSANRLILKILS